MNASFQTFVVGRANSTHLPDIVISASEDTVGRRHAELSVSADGRGDCVLIDLGSRNGTFIQDGASWKKIQQATISLETPIRLGSYQTTATALLLLQQRVPSSAAPPPLPSTPPSKKPRRNPLTGEIE